MTAKIVKSPFPGHVLDRPDSWSAPYVFASPHSGRHYPLRFLTASVLELADLRRSEDAYVDELLPAATAAGAPCLKALFPRAFVDVNRSSEEIDPTMFASLQGNAGESRSNRVLAGFGVIPRLAAAGQPIYAQKLPAEEAEHRIGRCYAPYHHMLARLIEEALERFGHVVLLDWHSMPSNSAGTGRHLPDVVLGDRFGAACDAGLVDLWEGALQRQGFSVGRNTPYAGGHVTTLYGKPGRHVHALQIELNRYLYLDELRTARHRAGFRKTRQRLAAAISEAMGASAPPVCLAAE